MYIRCMKYATLSIIISITGILLLIWFNLNMAEFFLNEIMISQNQTELNPNIFSIGIQKKMITILFGVIALIAGYYSWNKKNKIALIGIFLSFLLIVFSFVPIWQYFLLDSPLDINIK